MTSGMIKVVCIYMSDSYGVYKGWGRLGAGGNNGIKAWTGTKRRDTEYGLGARSTAYIANSLY